MLVFDPPPAKVESEVVTVARQYHEALQGILAIGQSDASAEEKVGLMLRRVSDTLYFAPEIPRDLAEVSPRF